MSMQDTVADMLTRIRNAQRANKSNRFDAILQAEAGYCQAAD
jgi:ribosomal protein S8